MAEFTALLLVALVTLGAYADRARLAPYVDEFDRMLEEWLS